MAMSHEQLSKERKHLQSIGEVPEWYTTQGYSLFKDKYSHQGETVKGCFERISKHLAQYLPSVIDAEKSFFDLLWSGKLAPSTPVMTNTGTNRGMSVSCAGSYIGDSVSQFYKCYGEIAMLSKLGFGTASYLGDIRSRGSNISSTGGVADGAVEVFDSCMNTVRKISQGATRRGAWAGYLPFSHDDFEEMLSYVQKNQAGSNLGVVFEQEDVDALLAGDQKAIDRFADLLYLRARTGKGYMWKNHTANANAPQAIKNSGIKIKGSQLCVHGDTKVLLYTGYHKISELNGYHNVWNGTEFSPAFFQKTGTNQKLIEVEMSSGSSIKCTPYHKFYVKGKKEPIEAKDLKVGDKLQKCNMPLILGEIELDKAYQNGFYTGDGCEVRGKSRIYLYGKKKDLLDKFDLSGNVLFHDKQDRIIIHVDGLMKKYFVPSAEYTVKSRLDWLAGLIDSDGCSISYGGSKSVQISSIDKDFLNEVMLMLNTLGISPKINIMHKEDRVRLIKDKEWLCKACYRLIISSYDLDTLNRLGLETHRVNVNSVNKNGSRNHYAKVIDVRDVEGLHDTYCFNEPKYHKGVFNGQITGNCSEIALPSDEDHTFTCVLGSLNLAKWDEITDEDIKWSVKFLDCVCEDFIQAGSKYEELHKAIRFTKKARSIGMGTLGYHTYLQENSIPFDSNAAKVVNHSIYKRIYDVAKIASIELGELLGVPEWCNGTGMRNATLLTVAPNMSSALLCGSVSQGVEPIVTNAFIQQSAGGEMVRYNPTFVALMKERGKYNEEELQDIAMNHGGSVQHLDWLSDQEKAVFKTAYEIDQFSIIEQASDRQKNIDQAQSINLFFKADADERYVAEVHKKFLLDPYLKSLYYLRSTRGVEASKGSLKKEVKNQPMQQDEPVCSSCEG